MSEHILVPLDGSSNAENAVPYAGKLARMFDLPLRFVHVVDEDRTNGSTDQNSGPFEDYVADVVKRFELSELNVTTLFLRGHSARKILEEVEGAAFVVLASHGKTGFRATFIGSVADKVVRGSTVPVLVVPGIGRPGKPEFAPAIVALDGSEEAERALSVARRLTSSAGEHVVLVRAYSLPPFTGNAFETISPNLHEVIEQGAREYLDLVAEEDEETVLVLSDAAGAICRVANHYDARLVVMTASGKGLAGRVALGSTTDRVLHTLHRPLLIIPKAGTK